MKYAILILALLIGVPVQGEDGGEEPLGITVETGVVSQYLWRGYVINNSPSLQPAVTFSYRGFSVGSWSNFSLRVAHNQHWTEHDLTVEYSRSAGPFTLSAGYLDYRYPDLLPEEGNRTREVSAVIALSNYLNPFFKVYRDVSLGRGYYYNAGVSHSYATPWKVTLTPALALGLNQHMYQRQTAVSNADFGLTAEAPLGGHTKISAFFLQMVGHRSLFGNHHAFGAKLSVTN